VDFGNIIEWRCFFSALIATGLEDADICGGLNTVKAVWHTSGSAQVPKVKRERDKTE